MGAAATAPSSFSGFDLTTVFDPSQTYYKSPGKASQSKVSRFEAKYGYKLPASYIELLQVQNGGTPRKTNFPARGTSWSADCIAISSIKGFGGTWGVDGNLGQDNLIGEWGYPDIGVVICDCPSAGHDVVMLDYRKCGKQMERGEPSVIHVDQEFDYRKTFLAKDFATFVKGLRSESDAQDVREDRKKRKEEAKKKKKQKKHGKESGNEGDERSDVASKNASSSKGYKDEGDNEPNKDIFDELEKQANAETSRFKKQTYANAVKTLRRYCKKKEIKSSKDVAHYKGIGKSVKDLIDEVIACRP